MHFTDTQTRYALRFYYGLFTHNENAKSSNFNRIYFMGATSVQRGCILILMGMQPQL